MRLPTSKLKQGRLSRRELMQLSLLGGAAAWLGCGTDPAGGNPDSGTMGPDAGLSPDAAPIVDDAGQLVDATPSCDETDDNIEGPYYLAGAPQQAVLGQGQAGVRLKLGGVVRDLACVPLANAVVDLWQANDAGAYSSQFTYRGKVVTNASGRYQFETIVPGRYLNGAQYRPAHLHVKVSAPGVPLLTTQLYFAGDPFNGVDPFIRQSLIMTPVDVVGGKEASFDFSLRRA